MSERYALFKDGERADFGLSFEPTTEAATCEYAVEVGAVVFEGRAGDFFEFRLAPSYSIRKVDSPND